MHPYYTILAGILFSIYIIALLFICCYGCMQIHLVSKYMRNRKLKPENKQQPLKTFPFVTVQLPVYNESLVIERLIDAIAQFDYPKDKFEVQVLDDSTDDTTDIIALKVAQYKSEGLQIEHIRRAVRKGYKAGALQEGLQLAKGEFITLFDADFIPSHDFLRRTLPAFTTDNIGMVQSRWDHLNKNYSLLTHFQAFLLDAHFSVEQTGRNSAGYFINFSGTGGVWRKACMLDAGGWHADTLTEDFDISYRAQLKGWQFKYLEDVTVPAELPPVMSALKSQQYRWIKGNAETARKHLKNVLLSGIPLKTKVHACFHLMAGVIFISVFVASILSIPLLILKPLVPNMNSWFQWASFSVAGLFCLGIFHYVATVHTGFVKDSSKHYFFKMFPMYLVYSMGISFNNAVAATEGLMGKKTAFVRTPKFNVADGKIVRTLQQDKQKRIFPIAEMILVLYFLSGVVIAFYLNDYTMLPYHLMLAIGFGMICYFTFIEQHMQRQSKNPAWNFSTAGFKTDNII